MDFQDIQLDLGINYGAIATLRYSTNILTNGSGEEQRNVNWTQPLLKFQIGSKSLDRLELDTLLDFHRQVKGSAAAFRFKDWTDYQAQDQPIGIGDGTTTTFQLIKAYEVEGFSVRRPITKPIPGSVQINVPGGTTPYVVNTSTGQITFTTAPQSGSRITASFEFDVPVRFETDELFHRFNAYQDEDTNLHFLDSLTLLEERQPSPSIFDPYFPDLGILLNLGYDFGTVGGNRYNTSITPISSGYERRDPNWQTPRGRWNIGNRSLLNYEKDYFLAFFRNARGAASRFRFYDWAQQKTLETRFETDELSIRFDAYDFYSGEAIYNLSGLPVLEIAPFTSVSYTAY